MLSARDEAQSFHAGERALQERAGVAERMARIGPQVIREQMPEQHRQFFELLPFIIVGSVDALGQPTASLLAAPAGFVSSADARTLRVDALPRADDPLHDNLRPGAPLAVLGIQPHTRRRNRANGDVLERDALGFSLAVAQSFGNCPKYIHPREAIYVGPRQSSAARVSERLGDAERALIRRADTFFIASAHPEAGSGGARSHGVDVSHRGGPAGFAHFTDEATFSIPDFSGNNFFNTLGNLLLQPAAGLLFIDVANGDVLELEASAEALDGAHPLAGPDHTGRIVRFEIHRSRFFTGASALRFLTPAGGPDARVR
jgi:uncharacterized protein